MIIQEADELLSTMVVVLEHFTHHLLFFLELLF